MRNKILGIDLAKSIFQLCLLDGNHVVFNKKVTRNRLLDAVRQMESGTLVAMEACSTAHYWGRMVGHLGFEVCLIPPQHVKAFVKNHKNDANDALAICEAANRPDMNFVPVKNLSQQDLCALHHVRQSLVQKRVATSNQIRGLAAEYGIVFPQRSAALRQSLYEALEDASNGLTVIARRILKQLYEDWLILLQRTEEIEETLKLLSSQTAQWQQLQSIPGIGPLIASAFIAYVGD
ncbi:transposase (fragment) [Xenorhabdus bovienii str. feltiae Florida]|uniref:Transposase n=1 Tax=Xenorhabdus bovienii TaxID=40576 RepID=A0A0B6X538_XENBV